VDAVSDMYIILPSGATTNMKPSRDCRRLDPNSLLHDSLGFKGGGAAPQASPKPEKIKQFVYEVIVIFSDNKAKFKMRDSRGIVC